MSLPADRTLNAPYAGCYSIPSPDHYKAVKMEGVYKWGILYAREACVASSPNEGEGQYTIDAMFGTTLSGQIAPKSIKLMYVNDGVPEGRALKEYCQEIKENKTDHQAKLLLKSLWKNKKSLK